MPALSMFYGIIVRMQSEQGGKHHMPHIHAIYGDHEIVIALDGEVLEGSIPIKQRKMLEGWMAIHEDELMVNWKMLILFSDKTLQPSFEQIFRQARRRTQVG